MERADFRFSRRDVRASRAGAIRSSKVHLHRLEELEYLAVHRGGRGQSFVYELLFESGDGWKAGNAGPDRCVRSSGQLDGRGRPVAGSNGAKTVG